MSVFLTSAAPDDQTALDLEKAVSELTASDWITAGVILVVAIAIAVGARALLTRSLRSRNRVDPAVAVLVGRVVSYLLILVGLVSALESLGLDLGLVIGGLGIAGIALAFALKDILENFVAGVLLQIQRPFTYGDQVFINEHEGTVRDINSRLVTIVTPAGETVKIPSATVIKADITNYTERGSRRTTLAVGVAYGTDLRSAQAIILGAVRRADGVLEKPDAEALLEEFGDSSINFAVRFWHKPTIADFWRTRSEVAFAVVAALADADITIPFPQTTVWWAGDADS